MNCSEWKCKNKATWVKKAKDHVSYYYCDKHKNKARLIAGKMRRMEL